MCEILINILNNSFRVKLRSVTHKNLYFFSTQLLPKQIKTPNTNTTTSEALQKILRISAFEAMKLISTHKKLSGSHTNLIQNNFEICKQNKLSKQCILNYPYILSEKYLDKKIDNLKMLPLKLNLSVPLVQLPQKTLYSIKMNVEESMEKLARLSTMFELPIDKACETLSKRSFLIYKPIDEIEELLNILHKHGFTKEDILKDLWIFKYSKDFIMNRLKFIQDQEILVLKTWMIRCPEDILIKHIKRESENRVILGENSLVQYLSEKLNCSEPIVKMLIKKHPQLQHKSLSQMNLMIDLLCKQGFTKLQICRVPKILLHSKETTLQRLKQLISLGQNPDRLYILTKSQKLYNQYLENIIKSQKESTD